MVFFLAAALLLANPVDDEPVQNYQGYTLPTTFPAATVSEQKFKKEDPRLIDELTYINKYINASITYVFDQDQYGIGDKWVMDPASHMGDCEDYALTKWSMIQQLGNRDKLNTDPIEKLDGLMGVKIVTVVVDVRHGQDIEQDGHAILAVKLPKGSVAYLDLNNDELMTRKELTAWSTQYGETARYEFWDWN